MIHHREKSEVRRFDIFKLIVLIILILLLLWFWLSPPAFVQGPDEMGDDTAVATEPTEAPADAATNSATDEPMAEETAEIEAAETVAPEIEAPTLESPALSDGLEPGTVNLSGSGTPGSTVRLILDGAEVGTTEVGDDGRWAFDLDLQAGSRTVTLEALDADGSVAQTADLPTVLVALDIPTLELPEGDLLAGPIRLGGTATPGSEVGIVIDDELVGTAPVGEDGTWSFDTELAAGLHGLHVQAIDASGNVAGESEGFGLTLGELILPDFDLPSLDFAAGDVEIGGVGTPGSTVELVANGEVIGTAVISPDGTWTIPTNLDAGDYDFSLRMLDANGNLLAESESRSTTVADAVPELFTLPTFDLPAADLTGGDVTLTGTGTPGAELEIVVNGEVVGTAVVADDGAWEFPTTLPAGDYELALRTVDGAGTAVETEPIAFSLAETADTIASSSTDEAASLPTDFCADAEPGIDQGDTYIVARCEWLTKIANRLGIPYTNLIGVNPQIENQNLIYPGQIINLPPR